MKRKNMIFKVFLLSVIIFTSCGFGGPDYTGSWEMCGLSGWLYEIKSDGTIRANDGQGTVGRWEKVEGGIRVSELRRSNGVWREDGSSRRLKADGIIICKR